METCTPLSVRRNLCGTKSLIIKPIRQTSSTLSSLARSPFVASCFRTSLILFREYQYFFASTSSAALGKRYHHAHVGRTFRSIRRRPTWSVANQSEGQACPGCHLTPERIHIRRRGSIENRSEVFCHRQQGKTTVFPPRPLTGSTL